MMRVFSRLTYLLVALIIAVLVYAGIVWIPEWNIIQTIAFNPYGMLVSDVENTAVLLFASLFDLAIPDTLYALLLSLLIGVNSAMLLFFYRMHKVLPSKMDSSLGIAGTIAGILGFGCAACGSLFASVLLSSVFGAGFAAQLPLNGFDFQLVGIVLLLFSIFQLSHAINKPAMCPI